MLLQTVPLSSIFSSSDRKVGALAGAWATEEIPSFGIAVPSARVDPQEVTQSSTVNYGIYVYLNC